MRDCYLKKQPNLKSINQSIIHSFIHSFIHSCIHSFIHSFIVCLFVSLFVCSFVCLFVLSFIHSLVSSFIHLFVCLLFLCFCLFVCLFAFNVLALYYHTISVPLCIGHHAAIIQTYHCASVPSATDSQLSHPPPLLSVADTYFWLVVVY